MTSKDRLVAYRVDILGSRPENSFLGTCQSLRWL